MDGSLDDLRAGLAGAGLAHHADALLALARPSIRLVSSPISDEGVIAVGATKLGGRLDVPADFVWPRQLGVPLSFVAQVNLAEVAVFDEEGLLPAAGHLCFFVIGHQEYWGEGPSDRTGWRVVFSEPGVELVRQEFPIDMPLRTWWGPLTRFPTVPLEPRLAYSLPPGESNAVERSGLRRPRTFEEVDEFSNYGEVRPDEHPAHRLLGCPRQMQGDIQSVCLEEVFEINSYLYHTATKPEAEKVFAALREWRLLLQVDSDEHAQMNWCSGDTMYYMIREPDLRARRWDQTWLTIECS